VSSSWRSFIKSYLFSSDKNLELLTEKAWMRSKPAEVKEMKFDGSIRAIACDNESASVVVGLINHKNRSRMAIIQGDKITQTLYNPDDDNFAITGIKVDQNKNFIVVTKSGTEKTNNRIDLDIVEVICKITLKTIFRQVVENSRTWIQATVTGINIIIRDGFSLTYLRQYKGCDNILPDKQLNLNTSFYNQRLYFHEQFVIIGCGRNVTLFDTDTRDEVNFTIEEEVSDIVVSWPSLIIISDFKILVIKYSNKGNKNEVTRTRVKSKIPHRLIAGLSVRNNFVLAAYDVKDKCHLFKLSDILKDSTEVVSPIQSFYVPSFSDGCGITTIYPILCLTPTSLFVSYPGTDKLDKFCVWNSKFNFLN